MKKPLIALAAFFAVVLTIVFSCTHDYIKPSANNSPTGATGSTGTNTGTGGGTG
ncbi:MAG: hypothetical protein JSU01_08845, partial [Bacteroidetes bacterium]|nr:hypothetical protein [Bacteroidota bacterium]